MSHKLWAVKKSERSRRLADDFVASTMAAIKVARHRRTKRRRALSTASVALVMVTALAGGLRWSRASLRRNSSPDALREQVVDRAMAYELSRSASTPAAGDYLLPNTASLVGFTSTYSDSSWQYDPDWRWTR